MQAPPAQDSSLWETYSGPKGYCRPAKSSERYVLWQQCQYCQARGTSFCRHAPSSYAQQEQLQVLQVLRQQQTQALNTYVARYQKNPEHIYTAFNKAVHLPDTSMLSELESVRLRLELEAEAAIEAKVNELRRLLQAAAKEEINLVLQNSAFSSEISHQESP